MTTRTEVKWSVGGEFLEALSTRDFDRLSAALAPTVRFRALLPPGLDIREGRQAVVEALHSWFGAAQEFELLDATVGEVGGRLHIAWRFRVRPAPFGIGDGWHVVEQQVYADAGMTIESLDLLCSGFSPEPPRAEAV